MLYKYCFENEITRIEIELNGRVATANLSQARSNILPQNFLTGCFLQERIETQNLGKNQTLPALPAVAALNGN